MLLDPEEARMAAKAGRWDREKPFTSVCCMLLTQLCPTLFDSMDCSLPGSSVHGILQTRILEQVIMPSSR